MTENRKKDRVVEKHPDSRSLLLAALIVAAGMLALLSSKAMATPATTCLLAPSAEVNVGTPVDGVLEVVNVDRGDLVTPGQVLAKLNTGVEQASVQLSEAKAQFGERKVKRNEDLEKKQLISQHELDELRTEREISKLELEERREQLKLRTLYSPIRGVVVDRYRNRGDLVKQEKIFRLAQIDPMYVETVVPAELFNRIRANGNYNVEIPQLRTTVSAKVATVDRVVDPASSTFRVRLVFANATGQVPAGLRCAINF